MKGLAEGIRVVVNCDKLKNYRLESKAIRDHVDEDDKMTERFVLSGQNRKAIVINESGLYSLIIKSKLPSAKQFKRWYIRLALKWSKLNSCFGKGKITPIKQ